jgi:hypothetical protein
MEAMPRQLSLLMSARFVWLWSLLAALTVGSAVWADGPAAKVDPQHPLAPALKHAYAAREALTGVQDYEAVFSKRELMGRRLHSTSMKLKLREEPFSVYLQYVTPHAGREVIYVAGRNNGLLLAHETGLKAIAGTVSLSPDSKDAMDGNRYPVTMIGMRNLLEQVITQWEAEAQFGECEVKYYPDAKLGQAPCKVIESTHPQPRKQFKFQKTMLFIDNQTGYPVRVEQHGFPDSPRERSTLVEEYTYSSIRVNLGLTDRDFDHTNPNYAFPR